MAVSTPSPLNVLLRCVASWCHLETMLWFTDTFKTMDMVFGRFQVNVIFTGLYQAEKTPPVELSVYASQETSVLS